MSPQLAPIIRSFRLALAFLTVIPLRWMGEEEATEADLARSRLAYPAVGLAIGLVLAALSETLRRGGTGAAVAAFLLVAAGVAITGGLHLDGLADTCDGLFLWGDPGRRLAAMRDPHVGSFGVTAIVLVLLGKFAFLSDLTGPSRTRAVLAAAAVGRTLVLVSAGSARYARLEGTGRVLIEATSLQEARIAAVGVLILGAVLAGRAGLVAGAATLGLAWGVTHLATRRLGGITGDLLGALVELAELVFLVSFALASSG